MKVGIVTIAYGENYGNRLQNYALQETLKRLGVKPKTIRDTSPHGWSLKKRIILQWTSIKKYIMGIDRHLIKRVLHFRRFNNRYIAYSVIKFGYPYSYGILKRLYPYFVVGSDQVWNAYFDDIKLRIYNMLASFADGNSRIAYAASFGQMTIRDDCKSFFLKELPQFKSISVRENSGVELVEQCGAKAVVTLDPTMLLTDAQWRQLEKKPKGIPEGEYIATYLFSKRDSKMNEYLNMIAGNKKIVHIYDKFAAPEQIDDPDIYSVAPDEFLWIVSHASCILTDSFHGAVFSIIFHKPFIVFDRVTSDVDSKMGSRIKTLLETFHIESCMGDIWNPSGFPEEQDWEHVDAILKKERENSTLFLRKALNLE